MLFLVGIGSTFKLHTIRYALIGVKSLLLFLATVLLLQQPGLPEDDNHAAAVRTLGQLGGTPTWRGGGTVMRAGCRWSGPGSRRWSGTVITLDG